MKQSDIAMIVVVAVVGLVVSFFACNALLPTPDKVEFKTIDEVSADVAEPSSDVFNSNAIDPTVEVYTNHSDETGN